MRSYILAFTTDGGLTWTPDGNVEDGNAWALVRSHKIATLEGLSFLTQFAEIVCYFHDSDGHRVEGFAASPMSFVQQINWLGPLPYFAHPKN